MLARTTGAQTSPSTWLPEPAAGRSYHYRLPDGISESISSAFLLKPYRWEAARSQYYHCRQRGEVVVRKRARSISRELPFSNENRRHRGKHRKTANINRWDRGREEAVAVTMQIESREHRSRRIATPHPRPWCFERCRGPTRRPRKS